MPLRFAVALALLFAVPSRSPAADPPRPKAPELALEAYTLPNGLKVALHRDPLIPRVTVTVAYHVGAKNERAGRTGFAHFFEHMMFRGTKNVPNYDIPLQEAGAQSNAFTSEDMTVYFETVPSNFLERALYLEAERLAFLPSALDQKKFDTEREVVKNERRQSYENVPYGLAEETILASVFPKGHPYSWSVIGSMKDLNDATLDDLKRFFAEFYHPANATLVLAGDFDPAAAKSLIAKYFGPLAAGPKPKPVDVSPVPSPAKKVVQADKVQLPRVYWNWPTVPDDHPDSPALDLLAEILAGGEASRLHKALVLEARVAKDVGAGSDTKESAGLFQIQSTAAEAKDGALEAIEAILAKNLELIRNQPPTAGEMARALALHEKSAYASLTPPLGRAITLAVGFAQKDDPNHYRKDFARYFAVTPADVQRVAKTYLPESKVDLWIVPAKPGEAESEALQAGPPAVKGEESPAVERKPAPGPDWTKMPGPSAPVEFRAPRIVRKSLSNGVDVWFVPWKTLPLVTARLTLPAGTGDDPKGKSGLATLSASLLDKGTASKTATELAEALEDLGVTLGAGVGVDETSVGFSTVARNFDPAMTLLGEVLKTPRLDPKDFDREKSLQLAGLLQGPDSVGWIARRAFRAVLYGVDHPYGNPGDGFRETVEAITADDVRKFYGDHFGPKGSILIVVGDIEPAALFASLEASLGGWKPQKMEPKPRPEPALKAEPGVAYLVDKPGAVQSVIDVGRRWTDRSDPRYFSTLLGNRILGGDFLSRLNQNLREDHGFTYGAGSTFDFRRTGSVWFVSTQVRADATAPALKEVIAELDGLAGGKPFTEEEIGTALDAESRSYPETFESPGSIAGILEEMAQFGLPPDYLDTFLARLQETKPETIGKAMAEVAGPKERVVLVVGDRKAIEPKLKALGFKEVRVITPDGKPAK